MKKYHLHIDCPTNVEETIVTIFAESLDEAHEHADRYYGDRCVRIRPHVNHSES